MKPCQLNLTKLHSFFTRTILSEQSQACYPTEYKNKVSRLAILKKNNKKTSEQRLVVTYIVLHVD